MFQFQLSWPLTLLQITCLTRSSFLVLPFPGHQHGKRPLEEAKMNVPSSTAAFPGHPGSAAAAGRLHEGRQSFWDFWNAVHRDNCVWLSFHLKDSFCCRLCKGLLNSVDLCVYCLTRTHAYVQSAIMKHLPSLQAARMTMRRLFCFWPFVQDREL